MNLYLNNIKYEVAGKEILSDVSFAVESGDIVALLGENGAGKTTLFEIIAHLIRPVSGEVLFDEKLSFSASKGRIGIVWDNIELFPWLKVKEVIAYVQSMYHIGSLNVENYSYLELAKIENNFMHKLSRGEKKRVYIYLSTLHNPSLLLLDEPTSELDPRIRSSIWNHIFLRNKRTVLFSSHMWEEARKYATKIIFLSKGKILNAPCSTEELFRSIPVKKKVVVSQEAAIDLTDTVWYEAKSNVAILIPEGNEGILKRIRNRTTNYTLMPVELEDLYYYLMKTKNENNHHRDDLST